MTRVQLEHVILAAGAIADTQDLVAIGSQAILGGFPNAPSELLISNKADLFPREHAERSELIDGSIGGGSPFEHEFGYYAHGVGEATAILPEGWRDRLILVTGENTRFVRGWCLEVHDLAIAKYAAGREKDLDFTKALARHGMIQQELLEERLAGTAVDRDVRGLISARIRRDFARAR
jgi:hypothetical protein